MKYILRTIAFVFGPIAALTALVYLFSGYEWYGQSVLSLSTNDNGTNVAAMFAVFGVLISLLVWGFAIVEMLPDDEPKKKKS